MDIMGIKEQVGKFGLGAFYFKAVQVRKGRRKGGKFCNSDTEGDDEVEFQVASKTYMMQNVHLYVWIYLIVERLSIAFTANVRLKFPVYQKIVKFVWFQVIFCLLTTAMEQVLKTEK